MNKALKRSISQHVSELVAKAQSAADGLSKIIDAAQGAWLGPAWSADLVDKFVPDRTAGEDTPHSIALRAQAIRASSPVRDTGFLIASQLFEQSRAHVDAAQRDAYTRDQEERARIYDAATNPGVKITATVTSEELSLLPKLPLDGHDRDEWLKLTAAIWRENFTAAVVRSLAGTSGGVKQGLNALASGVSTSFEGWRRQVATITNTAAITAMNASRKEFLLAFIPPEKRATSMPFRGSLSQMRFTQFNAGRFS